MKTRNLIFSGLVIMTLSSCVVKSLHSFYHEDDVIFDGSLVGSWIDEDSSRWVISPFTFPKGYMEGDSSDNSYLVELYEEGEEIQKFNVNMFRLNGRLYLDFMPILGDHQDDFLHIHLVPTHSLALAEKDEKGGWTIGWFNEEWLNKLFEENRVRISHEVVRGTRGKNQDQYVLTASTDELQKFIGKYGVPDEGGLCKDEDNFLCVQLTKDEQ